MKKFWKYIMISAAAVALMPLAACDDDDTVDSYDVNYCYIYQPKSTYASVEYKANGDFMSGLTDPLKVMPVRLTKPAPGNMQIEVAIDPSLIDEYNEAHETDYKMLQGAEILNPVMTIAAGEYISADSITIGFTDHSGFINQESDLILPVVIRSANGAVISKSSRIFLTFNSTYKPNKMTVTQTAKINAVTIMPGWQDEVKKLVITDCIKLSYEPYEEVTINLKIDQSKVADYNAANGTSYLAKNDATLESSVLTIGTDAKSASFSINSGDLSGVANGDSYVIPVVISSVSGGQIETDPENSVVYVLLRSISRELTMSTGSYNGTPCNNRALPANTTVTVDGSDSYQGYNQWIDILDSSSWAYGYMTTDQEMSIDFGETINLSSFYLNHWYGSYAASSITLQTSTDGNTWIDWGSTSWTDQAGTYYINLSSATPTRYMKITFPTGHSSYIEIDGMKFYVE